MGDTNVDAEKTVGGRTRDRCTWRASGAVSLQTCESRPEDCEGCPVYAALDKVAAHRQKQFFSRDYFDQCSVDACAVSGQNCPFAGPCMANWSRTNGPALRTLTLMGVGGLSIGTNASLVQQISRRVGLHADLVSRLFELRGLGKLGPDEKLGPIDLDLRTTEEQFALVASASFLDCLDSLDLNAFAESMFEGALLGHGLLESFSGARTAEELWNAFWAVQGLAILDVISAFDVNVLRKLHEAITTLRYDSMTMAWTAVVVQRILQPHTHSPVGLPSETIERAATLVGFAGGLLGKVHEGLSVTPAELAAALIVARTLGAVTEDAAMPVGRVLMDTMLRSADAGSLDAPRMRPVLAGLAVSGLKLTLGDRSSISKAVLSAFQKKFKKTGDMRVDPFSLMAVLGADNLVRDAEQFEMLASVQVEREEALDPALLGCEMPAELFYGRGHSWVKPSGENVVRIGLDDLAAHLVGGVDAVEMPEPGQPLRQGKPALRLIRGGEAVDLRSPLDGEVAAINQSVVDAPEVLSDRPYEEGWLIEIRPRMSEKNLTGLMFGETARRWQRNEAERLGQMFGGKMATAADGATLAHDALSGIPGVRWSKVLRKFFKDGS